MDPLSGISLASSALTFVDFAAKIVSGAREIQKSSSGLNRLNQERGDSARRLFRLSRKLEEDLTNACQRTTPEEDAIFTTASACAAWSRSLEQALASVGQSGAISTGRKHVIGSVAQSIKSMWKENEIKEAEQFLERCCRDLHTQMTAALLNHSSGLCKTVQSLAKMSERLNRNDQDILQVLDTLRKDLLSSLHAAHAPTGVVGKQQTLNQAVLSNLQGFQAEGEQLVVRATAYPIMRSLWFERITARRRQVTEKHEATYQWIFDDEHCGQPLYFLQWLESGDGLYWISGKPGAGKSTMMKAIVNDQRTHAALMRWAHGLHDSDLILADFFFWRPGQALEKSIEGLLRSLLYSVFDQKPAMIKNVLPERWKEVFSGVPMRPWELPELKHAVKSLGCQRELGLRFCFVIDGLDEYAESPSDVAETIRELASIPGVKLLVASRPWNEFKSAFGQQPGSCLIMHEHTKADISLYANSVFGRDKTFDLLRENDIRYQIIIDQVVEKAEGVFLWVFLVSRIVLRSLCNAEPFETLQRRVEEFPGELEQVFRRILDDVLPEYRQQSSQLILMYLQSQKLPAGLELGSVQYLTEPHVDFHAIPEKDLSETVFHRLSNDLGLRMEARCRDLLVVSESTWRTFPSLKPRIEVLHRTMLDYIQSPEIQTDLEERAGPEFKPVLAIYQGLVANWKFVGSRWAILTQPWYAPEMNDWPIGALNKFCGMARGLGDHDDLGFLAIMEELQRMAEKCWGLSRSGEVQQDLLMSLAIQYRLYAYIQSRITAAQVWQLRSVANPQIYDVANPQIYDVPQEVHRFVLDGGPAMRIFCYGLIAPLKRRHDKLTYDDILTLRVLISKGGHFDKPSREYWSFILGVLDEPISHGDQTPDLAMYAELASLCLENGAMWKGPKAPDNRRTVQQVLRDAFAGVPEYMDMVRHAAARGRWRRGLCFKLRTLFKSRHHDKSVSKAARSPN